MFKILRFTVLLFPVLLFSACNHKQANNNAIQSKLTPLTLKKNLSVSVDSLGVNIGTIIRDLTVDSSGNIYLADFQQSKIRILSPKGHYLGSLGDKGNGPGEFQSIDKIEIYGDTLYALGHPNGLTEFRLDTGQLVRTQAFPNIKKGSLALGNPTDIYPLANGQYETTFIFIGPITKSQLSLSIEKHDLAPLDTLVRKFPPHYNFMYINMGGGVIHSINILPAGRDLLANTLIPFGPHGNIYEIHTDSLHIHEYDRSGKLVKNISADYHPAPLTQNDIDSLTALEKSDLKATFYKALKQNHVKVPGYWPVVKSLLVDDHGQCWVRLMTPGKPFATWWVFDTNGNPKWKFKLPADVTLYVVRNHELYGIVNKKDEYPVIVRYRVAQR